MELFSHPIVAIVFLLGLLIFVHELGHFVVGKLCGIGIEVFSIGFGPPIVKFTYGHTIYQLAWLPLGGYVKFAGFMPQEEVADHHRGQELYSASKSKRLATIIAGPLANFVLAGVIYTIMAMVGIEHKPAIIGSVRLDSPAQHGGLQAGDRVVAIDGSPLRTWEELQQKIADSAGQELQFHVQRRDQTLKLTVIPGQHEGRGRAGIALNYEKAVVTVIDDSSPIAQGGLRTGDEVVAYTVSGQKTVAVESFAQLSDLLLVKGKVVIEVVRAGRRQTLTFVGRESATLTELGIHSGLLTVATVEPPASQMLLTNDHIVAVAGKDVRDVYDLLETLHTYRQRSTIEMTVNRNGQRRQVNVTLKPRIIQEPAGSVTIYTLPVTFLSEMYLPPPLIERYSNPFRALLYGVQETWAKSAFLLTSLFGLFTGDVPLQALGGPILISKFASDSAKAGARVFFMTMAIISINLALINLFPIPVLDGGQLMMLGMEFVRRRRLSVTTIENFQRVGFVMVMCIFVLATYNDISRFWQTFLQSVVGFFE